MYLKRITVSSFKTIKTLDLPLDPGLNVIYGLNETGKSTILEALGAAFFVNADSTRTDVLEFRSWATEADPSVRVTFEARGKEYELSKTYLGSGKGRLTCKSTGLDTSNKDRINDELRLLLPLWSSDGRALMNTFWMAQRELEDTISSIKDDTDLRSALQDVLFKADGDIEEIKETIARKIADIGRGLRNPAKNPGILAASKGRLGQLQGEVERLLQAHASLENDVARQKGLT